MSRNVLGGHASRLRTAAVGIVVAILVGGCSGAGPAPLLGEPTSAPSVGESPLATEAEASLSPEGTKKPAPPPTKKPATYYKPPGWNGVSDVNCKDFDAHAHAQSFFKGTGGTKANDPYGLDGDHDASACELLP